VGGVKPLIAVAGRLGAAGKLSRNAVAFASRPYLECTLRGGGEPVVLAARPLDHRDARGLLRRFDGLILMGGSDVNPSRYGQAAHPRTYGVHDEIDDFESTLALAAIELELPTLAVCRGMQVVNVALGGTLHQHLPDTGAVIDHFPVGFPAPPEGIVHPIQVHPGTRLAKAIDGVESICGLSYHHQAVDEPAPGMAVAAQSADGVIEAMEHETGWVIGVQWHPEDTAPTDSVQQRLYDSFVEQAAGST
jgi:putative glutamine amidotransferase